MTDPQARRSMPGPEIGAPPPFSAIESKPGGPSDPLAPAGRQRSSPARSTSWSPTSARKHDWPPCWASWPRPSGPAGPPSCRWPPSAGSRSRRARTKTRPTRSRWRPGSTPAVPARAPSGPRPPRRQSRSSGRPGLAIGPPPGPPRAPSTTPGSRSRAAAGSSSASSWPALARSRASATGCPARWPATPLSPWPWSPARWPARTPRPTWPHAIASANATFRPSPMTCARR